MKEQILEKIKKLLALSNSTNIHEASVAASQAQRLMEKYSIEAEIFNIENGTEDEIVEDIIFTKPGRNVVRWVSALAYGLAINNGCYMLNVPIRRGNNPRVSIQIAGTKSDIQTVRYMFEYLKKEIDRLTQIELEYNPAASGKKYSNSFRFGAVSEINRRMSEAKEKERAEFRSNNTRDLAVVDQAIAQLNERRQKSEAFIRQKNNLVFTKNQTTFDANAYNRGVKAGSRIDLGDSENRIAGPKKKD